MNVSLSFQQVLAQFPDAIFAAELQYQDNVAVSEPDDLPAKPQDCVFYVDGEGQLHMVDKTSPSGFNAAESDMIWQYGVWEI